MRYECDNCGYRANPENLPDAQNLYVRLDPGGLYTDKECPKCGALCFPVEPKPKRPPREKNPAPGGSYAAVMTLLEEILDHAIADRGTPDAFFKCYTYPHDEMPPWVAKAEKVVAAERGRPGKKARKAKWRKY